jgi:hypothetical protein
MARAEIDAFDCIENVGSTECSYRLPSSALKGLNRRARLIFRSGVLVSVQIAMGVASADVVAALSRRYGPAQPLPRDQDSNTVYYRADSRIELRILHGRVEYVLRSAVEDGALRTPFVTGTGAEE